MYIDITQVIARIRRIGLLNSIVAAARVLKRVSYRLDEFDKEHGVETSLEVPLWSLAIPFGSAKYGVKYQAVDVSGFRRGLEAIPDKLLQSFTFIDLGCGKGRALLLAAWAGFGNVIGVEFSPELCEIAKENLSRKGITRFSVELQDASSFRFPGGPLLIFMYNPFGPEVMRRVVANIRSIWDRTNKVYLFYYRPHHSEMITSILGVPPHFANDEFAIWTVRQQPDFVPQRDVICEGELQ
jgi:predicted RNA methylase